MNNSLQKKIDEHQTPSLGVTQELKWKIVKTESETPRVKNFYLVADNPEKPSYRAGQYLTVKLSDQGPYEGKAYSISSAPHEQYVRLSIKQIGNFSEALQNFVVGDLLKTTRPYGFFYPDPNDVNPLVFVVGGIGITPCLSIIKDLAQKGDGRAIHLHYSNQTEADIAFSNELNTLEVEYEQLVVHHYITRENPQNSQRRCGRMQIDGIVNSVDLSANPDFFICGALDFTKSLYKELHRAGVPQNKIHTESFF